MYMPLWTSLLVAMHGEIGNAPITQSQFKQMWFKITLFKYHCIVKLFHFKQGFQYSHVDDHLHCLGINMSWKHNDTAQ